MMGVFETHSFMASITPFTVLAATLTTYIAMGRPSAGHVRYRCTVCPHVFQLTYTYEARKPGVKDKIVDMAFNGSGVRDTARVLKIGINTVIRALKNSHRGK